MRKLRTEAVRNMRILKQILMVLILAAIVSLTGLSSQVVLGQKNDNRPPKDTQKVKEREKPPPSNNNSNSKKKP